MRRSFRPGLAFPLRHTHPVPGCPHACGARKNNTLACTQQAYAHARKDSDAGLAWSALGTLRARPCIDAILHSSILHNSILHNSSRGPTSRHGVSAPNRGHRKHTHSRTTHPPAHTHTCKHARERGSLIGVRQGWSRPTVRPLVDHDACGKDSHTRARTTTV